MKRFALFAAAVILAGGASAQDAPTLVGPSTAQGTAGTGLDMPAETRAVDDATFVSRVLAATAFEIAAGRLAVRNAADDAVKSYGRRMATDHRNISDRLGRTITASGIGDDVPSETGSTGDGRRADLDRLAGLQGAAFDEAYVEMIRAAHEDTFRLFTSYAETGVDASLRDFAIGTLPRLQEHQAVLSKLSP